MGADGYLERVEDPRGDAYQMTYEPGGLLATFTNRNGRTSSFEWDDLGRLVSHQNPGGGTMTLTMHRTDGGIQVERLTPLGRATVYDFTRDSSDAVHRQSLFPSGLVATRQRTRKDLETVALPDGTVITTQRGPDPRFRMQAPVVTEQIHTLPGGLTRVIEHGRSVSLANPNDPLSLLIATDFTTVNGKTWTRSYDAASRTLLTTSPEGAP